MATEIHTAGGYISGECGQIWKPYLVPHKCFNFKDAMCQFLCTEHGLQAMAIRNSGWAWPMNSFSDCSLRPGCTL